VSVAPSPVLICTGFHRSATSVTAHWLSRAGMPLWLWSVGAHPSNPEGHFEDWAAVGLHDAVLARQGLDWQFADQAPWFPEAGIEALRRYVGRRDEHARGASWGMKDPRASIFLSAWQHVLGERGRFLFVLRHWGGCLDSLLRRHAAVLAAHEKPGRQHLKFWAQPLLGARMWLAYNRRLLAFARQHPGRVLLVTQRRLFSSLDLPAVVQERLGIPLMSADSPVRSALLAETADERLRSLIPQTLQAEMESLWGALLAACDYKVEDEDARWQASPELPLPDWVEAALATPVPDWSADASGIADLPHDLTRRLDILLTEADTGADSSIIFTALEQMEPFEADLWERLALLALRGARWELAESALERVVSFGDLRPYHFMLLGQARQGVGDEPGARFLFRKAIHRNPRNPRFHEHLARLEMLLGEHGEAEKVLREGLAQFEEPPEPLELLLCESLEQQGRRREAIDWLRAREPLPEKLESTLAMMEVLEGDPGGRVRYQRVCRAQYRGLDKLALLKACLEKIEHRGVRRDLARRLIEQWDRLSGDDGAAGTA